MPPASSLRPDGPPLTTDVAIVGAGAAGIAAARALVRAGMRVLVLEARERTGGRAVTKVLDGVPVDLGAHWLHSVRVNPLVPLARARAGIERASYGYGFFLNGRPACRADRAAFERAVEAAEWRIASRGEAAARVSGAGDVDAATAMGDLGPWTAAAAFSKGDLDCGAEPGALSAHDVWRADDHGDALVPGGLGRLVAGLAEGLPIRLDAAVEAVRWRPGGVRLIGRGFAVEARAAIVTAPVPVLQAGAIVFDPPLPAVTREALGAFHASAYEHAVIALDDAPWGAKRDRYTISIAGGHHLALFGAIGGRPLHYAELCGADARTLRGLGEEARGAFVKSRLARHFGEGAAGARVLAVSGWGDDPWSLGSWSLARPGGAGARKALRAPLGDSVWLAGEAGSVGHWGTVGGAWRDGERAAGEFLKMVGMRVAA